MLLLGGSLLRLEEGVHDLGELLLDHLLVLLFKRLRHCLTSLITNYLILPLNFNVVFLRTT